MCVLTLLSTLGKLNHALSSDMVVIHHNWVGTDLSSYITSCKELNLHFAHTIKLVT